MDFIRKLKEWCALKITLWNKNDTLVFKQAEIWWCSVGMNIGEESFGKGARFTRPVLIFRKFTSNSFLGLPITTQEKKGSWYVEIEVGKQKRWIMLNQARVFDKKRLTNRVATVSEKDFTEVRRRFLEFYTS